VQNLEDRLREDLHRAVRAEPDTEALFSELSRRRARRLVTRRMGTAALALAVIVASIGGFVALKHVFRDQAGPAGLSERNGSIVYTSTYGSHGPGDQHLWITDPDGSNAKQLTTGSGADIEAAISPDGQTVAFIRSQPGGRFRRWSLWTTTLTGDTRRLTHPINQSGVGQGYPHALSFSPDGSRIALDTGVFGPFGIWTVRTDGSDPRLIGGTDKMLINGVSWAPDGRSIVYSGSATKLGRRGTWDLYVVGVGAPAGDIGQRLTDTPGVDEYDPSWSPDGTKITYEESSFGSTGIGVMARNGAGATILATIAGCCLQEPTWAPDGDSLLFVDANKVQSLVQRISLDGSGRDTLFDGAEGPAWQPRPQDGPALPSPTASPSTKLSPPGFTPAAGWVTESTTSDPDVLDQQTPPTTWASNVAFDPSDLHPVDVSGNMTQGTRPYGTMRSLPADGVVIIASFTWNGDLAPPPANFPERTFPLSLADADVRLHWEGQIAPNVPEYVIWSTVDGRAIDVRLFFGVLHPSEAALSSAQDELSRLVLPAIPGASSGASEVSTSGPASA